MSRARKHDVADAALAPAGVARIEWADREMPVLRQIRGRFGEDKPFAGVRVAACMHVTAETANLLRALAAGGAEVAIAAANPLSTQDDTAAALARTYGVSVFARAGVDLDEYYRHIGAALDRGPDLVLDDGCDLLTLLHTERTELLGTVRAGCEQTMTGVLRLRAMAKRKRLRIPVIAANDAGTRRLFDRSGQSVIDALLRSTNALLAGRLVVVAGYGPFGRGIADAAKGLGASVVVSEVNPIRSLDAAMAGFTVMPMRAAASLGDIFITATGNRDVIGERHFAAMKDGAILLNAGHFDVEIDARWLKKNAKATHRGVRPHADEYVLPDGRRLVLLGEGRVANLAAAEGHPAAVMDIAFAGQALTAAWLAGGVDLGPGVYDIPAEIDAEVARLKLASMGVGFDELTDEQRKYLDSWEQGS